MLSSFVESFAQYSKIVSVLKFDTIDSGIPLITSNKGRTRYENRAVHDVVAHIQHVHFLELNIVGERINGLIFLSNLMSSSNPSFQHGVCVRIDRS